MTSAYEINCDFPNLLFVILHSVHYVHGIIHNTSKKLNTVIYIFYPYISIHHMLLFFVVGVNISVDAVSEK